MSYEVVLRKHRCIPLLVFVNCIFAKQKIFGREVVDVMVLTVSLKAGDQKWLLDDFICGANIPCHTFCNYFLKSEWLFYSFMKNCLKELLLHSWGRKGRKGRKQGGRKQGERRGVGTSGMSVTNFNLSKQQPAIIFDQCLNGKWLIGQCTSFPDATMINYHHDYIIKVTLMIFLYQHQKPI